MSPVTLYSSGLWNNRTVGLLGGSFNPAHEGHLHISLHALKMLGLDAVWWLVSPQNPLKSKKDMAPFARRLVRAREIAQHPRIAVTDMEVRMGTHFTADTIAELQKRFPRTRFVWLMGADNMHQLHRWKNWQKIFHMVPVCVLDRPPPGSSVRASKALERFRHSVAPGPLSFARLPSLQILHIPLSNVSATRIRAKKHGKPARKA